MFSFIFAIFLAAVLIVINERLGDIRESLHKIEEHLERMNKK